MTSTLNTRDLIALGFMTFALFLGAGNIIFPPMVGQLSGNQLWYSAVGFLLTGVGLPLLTVVALARVGGGMPALTTPLGKGAGTLLGVLVYLCIGPFLPRRVPLRFPSKWVWCPLLALAVWHKWRIPLCILRP
ncbi:branched-chain amino acid transport system II carrier protein [Paenalcaligenes niemegkensis]|uniref:branched-chain amino acid transport system II carrier protein n=1 Tax=Paenalcaligenes niemegkensis TaxID=2895469 RepID=UPI0027E29AAB|nr:branched-chain amino acid transport system II carrier protein [Paenalcaligenes niemegkensis]